MRGDLRTKSMVSTPMGVVGNDCASRSGKSCELERRKVADSRKPWVMRIVKNPFQGKLFLQPIL